MFYDAILSYLGEFGPYQRKKLFLVCLVCIPHGIEVCAVVFNFANHTFRCAVPGLDNDTYHIQHEVHERLVNLSVPIDSDTGQFSQCDVYANSWNGSYLNLSEVNQNHTTSCHRWVYYPDSETATATATASMSMSDRNLSWDIVCHRKYFKAHFKMAVMMGLLVGSFCGGPLSDYFGRKKLLVIGPLLHTLSGMALAFVTSPIQYMIIKFLSCFLGMTAYLTAFVMVAEIVGPKKRTLAELCTKYGWCVGILLLALVNYLTQNWRIAQLVLSVPCLGFASFWWLIDESPRWLIAKGRIDEAKDIMRVIAKVNNTKMPENLELESSLDSKKGDDVVNEKIWHVCASRVLVTRVIILCVGCESIGFRHSLWACDKDHSTIYKFLRSTTSMVYYGLTLNVGTLIEGSLYVNFTVQALLETIGYIVCHLVLGKVGRKPIYCGSLLLAGCACLAMTGPIFTKSNYRWINVLLFGLGKFGITASFTLVYIVTTELLPTSVRNSGLGFCSFMGRIAGIVSPYVASLGYLMSSEYGSTFTLIVFGTAGVVAGLSALVLPESRNKKLPETMDEASGFGRTVLTEDESLRQKANPRERPS